MDDEESSYDPRPATRCLAVACGAAVLSSTSIAQDGLWRAGEPLPGQIVLFADNPSDRFELAELFQRLGLYVVATGPRTGLILLRCHVGDESLWIDFAQKVPGIRAAEHDVGGYPGFTLPPTEMPQPSGEPPATWQLHDLWHLQNTGQTIDENSRAGSPPQQGLPGADINVLNAWSLSQGSSDIVVAVFDSGVDYDHPEFAGRLHATGMTLACPWAITGGAINCCSGTPLTCNFGNIAIDNHGHGTMVAGVLGANADNGPPSSTSEEQYAGVDPSCTIFPVRLSYDNIPSVASTLAALESLYFTDSWDVYPRVVNMSYTFGPVNQSYELYSAIRNVLDALEPIRKPRNR